MNSPIQNFLKALDKEEESQREKLAQDRIGLLLRSAISEFDWFHYNYLNQENPSLEQSEQYYICRLGMTRAILLSFVSIEQYDLPIVNFARRKDVTLSVLEMINALGMIEHGRRIAQSTKTGLCKIDQIANSTFEFTLPPVLADDGYHERSLVEHYQSETRRLFEMKLSKTITKGLAMSIEEKLSELVYVFKDNFIGYGAHPLLDEYFFGLGYHEIQLQEGFDTFHYATAYSGVSGRSFRRHPAT